MNRDDRRAPLDVRLGVACIVVAFCVVGMVFFPFADDYSRFFTLASGLGIMSSVTLPPVFELLCLHLRWRAVRRSDGYITFRRLHQTIIIAPTAFITLEYGLLGGRAVLENGTRLLLADDASAALLLGVALTLDELRKPGGPYRAR